MKRYILFAPLTYCYPILRPVQEEIRRRGDEAAWYIGYGPDMLQPGEKKLATIEEAIAYDPIASLTAANYIPDYLPGVKVALFHGYPITKRPNHPGSQFAIRGWFDIYCTQGPSGTPVFERNAAKLGFFKEYETGWTQADTYAAADKQKLPSNDRPTVVYTSTFTRGITSTGILFDTIRKMVESRRWNWLFTFHPKLDEETKNRYKQLAEENENAEYYDGDNNPDFIARADVMLCDSSSIITEFMLMNRPVVTFRNTNPGQHLIDVTSTDEIEPALEKALTRPEPLMKAIKQYTEYHEGHLDGKASSRVLDAIDDFISTGHKTLTRRKPLNLVRRIKLRRATGYPWWKGLFLNGELRIEN